MLSFIFKHRLARSDKETCATRIRTASGSCVRVDRERLRLHNHVPTDGAAFIIRAGALRDGRPRLDRSLRVEFSGGEQLEVRSAGAAGGCRDLGPRERSRSSRIAPGDQSRKPTRSSAFFMRTSVRWPRPGRGLSSLSDRDWFRRRDWRHRDRRILPQRPSLTRRTCTSYTHALMRPAEAC